MTSLAFNCTECNSDSIKYVTDKELTVTSINPGSVSLVANCYECQRCGEIYLDEDSSKEVAKELDKKSEK